MALWVCTERQEVEQGAVVPDGEFGEEAKIDRGS